MQCKQINGIGYLSKKKQILIYSKLFGFEGSETNQLIVYGGERDLSFFSGEIHATDCYIKCHVADLIKPQGLIFKSVSDKNSNLIMTVISLTMNTKWWFTNKTASIPFADYDILPEESVREAIEKQAGYFIEGFPVPTDAVIVHGNNEALRMFRSIALEYKLEVRERDSYFA